MTQAPARYDGGAAAADRHEEGRQARSPRNDWHVVGGTGLGANAMVGASGVVDLWT